MASTNLEAEAPKKGKGPLADNSAWDVDSSPERRPWNKPLAASPAHDNSQRSSSRGSFDSKATASDSPPTAYSPKAKGDGEVLSQRTFPGQGEVQEAVMAAPEGDTSAAGHMGEQTTMENDDGGHAQFGPHPNMDPETHAAPKSDR